MTLGTCIMSSSSSRNAANKSPSSTPDRTRWNTSSLCDSAVRRRRACSCATSPTSSCLVGEAEAGQREVWRRKSRCQLRTCACAREWLVSAHPETSERRRDDARGKEGRRETHGIEFDFGHAGAPNALGDSEQQNLAHGAAPAHERRRTLPRHVVVRLRRVLDRALDLAPLELGQQRVGTSRATRLGLGRFLGEAEGNTVEGSAGDVERFASVARDAGDGLGNLLQRDVVEQRNSWFRLAVFRRARVGDEREASFEDPLQLRPRVGLEGNAVRA
jgi:hypothetical protein